MICLMIGCLVVLDCVGQTIGTYQVVKSRSTLKWTGYYLFNFGEHTGTIDIVDGKVLLDEQQRLSGSISADMRSIKDTDMPYDDGGKDLGEHLISKDFFDAAQYPHTKIEIISTEALEDGGDKSANTISEPLPWSLIL